MSPLWIATKETPFSDSGAWRPLADVVQFQVVCFHGTSVTYMFNSGEVRQESPITEESPGLRFTPKRVLAYGSHRRESLPKKQPSLVLVVPTLDSYKEDAFL